MLPTINLVDRDIWIDLIQCKRNKNFPNNKLPVLAYRRCLKLPGFKSEAVKIVEDLFANNNWKNSWQDGIYDFHHYHSNTHECMGILCGSADMMLGGPKGSTARLEMGDVIILPAGTGHKCTKHSRDFLCVGAYPDGKEFDMKYGRAAEFNEAFHNIQLVEIPLYDPVFGKNGFLKTFWK